MRGKRSAFVILVSAGLILPPSGEPRASYRVSQPAEMDAEQVTEALVRLFYAHRPGLPSSVEHRDLELMWSDNYRAHRFEQGDSTLGLSHAEVLTLRRFGETLAATQSNPFGVAASDLHLAYDYFHPTGDMYKPNPADTIPFLIGGLADPDGAGAAPNRERAHVDIYLYEPGQDGARGGLFHALFVTAKEDSSTDNWANDSTWHAWRSNALMYEGPLANNPIDSTGTRWTKPDSIYNALIMHEFQHGLYNSTLAIGEIMSSGAEAVTGELPTLPVVFDYPYTWPIHSLNRMGPDTTGIDTLNVWNAGENYGTFRLFASYLAYNFRGADTSAVLPTTANPSQGLGDDLLYRWAHTEPALESGVVLNDLIPNLENAACAECSTKEYFKTATGDPLPGWERLQLLLHNMRIATYVNSSEIAEGQFGFNSERFGFRPSIDIGAWQDNDGVTSDNSVAIPPELEFGSEVDEREYTVAGTRYTASSLGPLPHPMRLQMMGSEFWVLRDDGTLGSDTDLVIEVQPESLIAYRSVVVAEGDSTVEIDEDARLIASVVAYTSDVEDLWASPEYAEVSASMLPRWVDIDAPAEPLRFVVPGFGTTYRAVVVGISLGDGDAGHWGSAFTADRPFAINRNSTPYRLSASLRSSSSSPVEPQNATPATVSAVEGVTWAPKDSALVFAAIIDSVSERHQIYRFRPDGSGLQRLSPSACDQYTPDYCPRGEWIAFAQDSIALASSTDIWIYNTTSGATTQLTDRALSELWPTFDPSGRRVAYANETRVAIPQGTGIEWEVRVTNRDGTADQLLIGGLGTQPKSLCWAADGAWVYFVEDARLYRVSSDGAETVVAVDEAGDIAHADVRRSDGQVLIQHDSAFESLYLRWENDVTTTYHVAHSFDRLALRDTASGSTWGRLYQPGYAFEQPKWSRDGTRAAHVRTELGGDVEVMIAPLTYDLAPTFTGALKDTILLDCGELVIPLAASDSDNDDVSFHATNLPPGASFDTTSAEFSWPEPRGGDHRVVFRAVDALGGFDERVVRITVPDTIRPAQITDLNPDLVGPSSVYLTWTASGDDSLTGTGCKYILRYSTARITAANFDLATTWPTYAPSSSGSGESATITNLQPNTWYWFAIKERDEVHGNLSAISNIDSAKTLTGGGGGFSAQRVGGGTVPSEAALAGQKRPDGEARHTAALPATEALVAEFSRSGETLEWRVYRLGSEESAALAGAHVVFQEPGESGWQTRTTFSASEPCSVLALRVGEHDRRRTVFVGPSDLLVVSAEASGGIDSQFGAKATRADHNRLGSLLSDLSPASGAFDLASGDTLEIEYGPGVSTAEPSDWSLLFFRQLVGAVQASRQPSPVEVPKAFALAQNHPNPFASSTAIRFDLPAGEQVRLEVFDPQGRRVARLASEWFPAGSHVVEWNRRGDRGVIKPGVYLYRITAGAFHAQKKLVILP